MPSDHGSVTMNATIPIDGFSRRITGWDDSQRQRCKCCGLPDKLSFYVPDEVWQAVVPPPLICNVVCLACFDDLARSKDVAYAASLEEIWFVGDQATFKLVKS